MCANQGFVFRRSSHALPLHRSSSGRLGTFGARVLCVAVPLCAGIADFGAGRRPPRRLLRLADALGPHMCMRVHGLALGALREALPASCSCGVGSCVGIDGNRSVRVPVTIFSVCVCVRRACVPTYPRGEHGQGFEEQAGLGAFPKSQDAFLTTDSPYGVHGAGVAPLRAMDTRRESGRTRAHSQQQENNLCDTNVHH